MTAWDPGLDFHLFLVDLGKLLGVDFYQFAVFFGTRLSILSVSSEVCFLMGLGEKMVPGSVVGWVWKHSKYNGFREVSLFHVFSELVDIQSTFGCLFGRFLGTLGSLFLIFEGLRSRSENR